MKCPSCHAEGYHNPVCILGAYEKSTGHGYIDPERAQYILDSMLPMGEFKYAFESKFSRRTYPDGITEYEDKAIRDKWNTMPGNTCYYDAVRRLARGE